MSKVDSWWCITIAAGKETGLTWRLENRHFATGVLAGFAYLRASACNWPGMSKERSWLDDMVSLMTTVNSDGMGWLSFTAFTNRFADIAFTSVRHAREDKSWIRWPLHWASEVFTAGWTACPDFLIVSCQTNEHNIHKTAVSNNTGRTITLAWKRKACIQKAKARVIHHRTNT